MLGHIRGEVLFSDGQEIILCNSIGIGYEIYCSSILIEGDKVGLYISHIIRESSQDLYGFSSLREKKLFELIVSVKGVGPKSAFSLVNTLSLEEIINAIHFESKKILTKAPGIGIKAASQIILDLKNKILKIKAYSHKSSHVVIEKNEENPEKILIPTEDDNLTVFMEAVMVCKELGFQEERVIRCAKKVLDENKISKAEQLVHLVLKEI